MKTCRLFILAFFIISIQAHAQKKDSAAVSNKAATTDGSSQVYTVVDHQPEFPGGMAALQSYIHNNMRCPDEAVQKGIFGKVFVRFVVTEIGTLKDIDVVKSIKDCESCDEAAILMIEKMPAWKPGKMKGEAVKVLYNLPVSFRCD